MGYDTVNHSPSKHCLTEIGRTLQSKRKTKHSAKKTTEKQVKFKIIIIHIISVNLFKKQKKTLLYQEKIVSKKLFLNYPRKVKIRYHTDNYFDRSINLK